ncbi:MAG: DUF4091 domain-containing protein [Verrucomicrobiaceae bacterium]|nr:DUF4091 domain-containing protein [Verrucomicrobiaceae bacterium]
MRRIEATASPPANLKETTALHAARGEWEPLQAILYASPAAFKTVIVEEASLIHAETGALLPTARIYRQMDVEITAGAELGPLPAGRHADALVPLEVPTSPEADSAAQAGCQRLWVDFFVPYTAGPGRYHGRLSFRLADGSSLLAKFTLDVWDFDMPATPSLHSILGITPEAVSAAHGLPWDPARISLRQAGLLNDYYDLLAEHRVGAERVHTLLPNADGTISMEKVEFSLRKHLLHRHAPATALPIRAEWPFAAPLHADRLRAETCLADYGRLLEKIHQVGRMPVILDHLHHPADEAAYATLREWGAFLNEVEKKHGVKLPLLVTTSPVPASKKLGRLDGVADIWALSAADLWTDMEWPGGGHESAVRRQAGDQLWLATRPQQPPAEWVRRHPEQAGKLHHSHPPVLGPSFPPEAHRVFTWYLAKYGITGLLHEKALAPAPQAGAWAALTGMDTAMIYPATTAQHGRDFPVASIRLKWLREALEDYDYLVLARDLGLADRKRQITETFARSLGDWDANMPALMAARFELARMIEQVLKRRQTAASY